jgi:hypothetical protein
VTLDDAIREVWRGGGQVQLTPAIEGLKEDVRALAGLGDDASARAGELIAGALGPAAMVRLLDILGQAAVEVSAQLGTGHSELRVAGNEATLVVVAEEPSPAPDADEASTELSARLTLRLPEQLKARIERAADREGASTNSWIVRVLTRATSHGTSDEGRSGGPRITGLPGRRLRGFGST